MLGSRRRPEQLFAFGLGPCELSSYAADVASTCSEPRCGTLGCRVRAGARDPQKAQGFLQTALQYGLISPAAAKRLTLVPVDLTDVASIAPAIGNAGKVCAVHSGLY